MMDDDYDYVDDDDDDGADAVDGDDDGGDLLIPSNATPESTARQQFFTHSLFFWLFGI